MDTRIPPQELEISARDGPSEVQSLSTEIGRGMAPYVCIHIYIYIYIYT